MSDSPSTRPSLLLRIRDASDAAAWQQFVEIYAPLIYDYGRARGLQDADAADLAQDVLRKFAGKANEFDYNPERGSFRGWLFTVTRNQIYDQATRRRAGQGTGETVVHQRLAQQPDEQSDEKLFEQHHQWRLFNWAAEKVRVDFREATFSAFWQTAVDNMPPREVAQALGISVGAVHIAKSRVLARIRALLETLGDE